MFCSSLLSHLSCFRSCCLSSQIKQVRLGQHSGQCAEHPLTHATNTPSVSVCVCAHVFAQFLVHLMIIQAFLCVLVSSVFLPRSSVSGLKIKPRFAWETFPFYYLSNCVVVFFSSIDSKTVHFCVNTTCSRLICLPVSAPLVTAMCCCNVTPFTTKC